MDMPLNDGVAALAAQHRFRTHKLEDGELVIALPGKTGAHAGRWGETRWYVLAPCDRPATREAGLVALQPALQRKSGDAETLVLGTREEICALLLSGPVWCRGRRKRTGGPSPHLAAFSFRRREQVGGAGSEPDGSQDSG